MARKTIWAFLAVVAVGLSGFALVQFGCDPTDRRPSMVLYGIVVDQSGVPVPGAEVHFDASRFDMGLPFYSGNEQHWEAHALTDGGGRFTVKAGKGDLLQYQYLKKIGFSEGIPAGPFSYGGLNAVPRYHPDPKHPVQFMMWNEAFRHVLSEKITASVDGQLYTLAYRDLKVKSELGGADFSFKITKPAAVPPPSPFDWQLTVRGVGCKLQKCPGPLGSEDPAKEYVPELKVTVSAADPDWSKDATLRFYTRSDHGEVYAGVEMHVSVGEGNKNSDVTIAYTANFGNSRDLAPGPATHAKK